LICDDRSPLILHQTDNLTPESFSARFVAMEAASIKVIGQIRKTAWQRFSRLQRTTAALAFGRGQPKGVFRFSSHEACDKWTRSLTRHEK
jgi:hypothetical protein